MWICSHVYNCLSHLILTFLYMLQKYIQKYIPNFPPPQIPRAWQWNRSTLGSQDSPDLSLPGTKLLEHRTKLCTLEPRVRRDLITVYVSSHTHRVGIYTNTSLSLPLPTPQDRRIQDAFQKDTLRSLIKWTARFCLETYF